MWKFNVARTAQTNYSRFSLICVYQYISFIIKQSIQLIWRAHLIRYIITMRMSSITATFIYNRRQNCLSSRLSLRVLPFFIRQSYFFLSSFLFTQDINTLPTFATIILCIHISCLCSQCLPLFNNIR